jgi:hypothetical protein
MARYEQGETLSSIARTYDCSPPAISYIVSRSREKAPVETAPVPPVEPQLIKTSGNGAAGNGAAGNGAAGNTSAPIELTEAAPQPEASPESRPSTAPNGAAGNGGEPRRTLHLSLGNGQARNGSHAANGNGPYHEPAPARPVERPLQTQNGGNGHQPVQPAREPSFPADRGNGDLFALPERKPAQQPRDPETPHKENSAFIDRELRNRVDGDIAAFLAAFDAALAADTQENRFGLREATDRLLRAGARTRIEVERLAARVPLSPPEGRASAPGWRYR